jgi:hypothetical protein
LATAWAALATLSAEVRTTSRASTGRMYSHIACRQSRQADRQYADGAGVACVSGWWGGGEMQST